MPYRWVVDVEHPKGHLVELSADEETQRQLDEQAWLERDAVEDVEFANAETMREAVLTRLDQLAAVADKIAAGEAPSSATRSR
jgi:hypothetical protein